MTSVRASLAVVACCLALAGCADDSTPSPTRETAVDETSEPTPSEPATTPTVPGGSSPAALMAVDDLAANLGVGADEVEVVAVEEVTWRNGSRGCAEPGMAYTQALIEGQRITLSAGGRTYEYHAGGSRPPALCRKPTE